MFGFTISSFCDFQFGLQVRCTTFPPVTGRCDISARRYIALCYQCRFNSIPVKSKWWLMRRDVIPLLTKCIRVSLSWACLSTRWLVVWEQRVSLSGSSTLFKFLYCLQDVILIKSTSCAGQKIKNLPLIVLLTQQPRPRPSQTRASKRGRTAWSWR